MATLSYIHFYKKNVKGVSMAVAIEGVAIETPKSKSKVMPLSTFSERIVMYNIK